MHQMHEILNYKYQSYNFNFISLQYVIFQAHLLLFIGILTICSRRVSWVVNAKIWIASHLVIGLKVRFHFNFLLCYTKIFLCYY